MLGRILFLTLPMMCESVWSQVVLVDAPEKWSVPVKVTALGSATYDMAPSLTAEGRTMFLNWDNRILTSTKTDSGWTTPIALNDSVNEPGSLTEAPSISPDGKTLYFRRYVGDWRILQSRWNEFLSVWGTPTDLGFNINELGGWYGMTPDTKHFFYHRNSLPRVSTWDDTLQAWGPSSWVDYYTSYDCRGGLSVTWDLRKLYYDIFENDIVVQYYDTASHSWSNVMTLNLNRMMDTLSAAKGTIQRYPWISHDKKHLHFASDHDGTLSIWTSTMLVDENGDTVLSVVSPTLQPTRFRLDQNFPNPFNLSTTIKFEVPKSSQVRLSVFDILGREVSVLVNERRDAGVHEVKFDGSHLASGVYFYRIVAGSFTETKRLLLIR